MKKFVLVIFFLAGERKYIFTHEKGGLKYSHLWTSDVANYKHQTGVDFAPKKFFFCKIIQQNCPSIDIFHNQEISLYEGNYSEGNAGIS